MARQRRRRGAIVITASAVTLLALAAASPAYAHKLKVFATAVGPEIDGSVYFVGGGPAPGATIRIATADGKVLATLHTGADGAFAFTATTRADHLISVDAGDGHSARITIAADDLPSSLPSPAGAAAASAPLLPVPGAAAAMAPPATTAAVAAPAAATAIEDLVARAVAQQIRPLREQINAYEDQVRLRDIAGGIGYIVGLAGLAMWLHGRRPERRR